MPFVICPKHGGHESAAVCTHIFAELAKEGGEPPPHLRQLYPVGVTYESVKLGLTWVCYACAKEHGVPAEGLTLTGEKGLDQFWSEIGFTPVCPKCFEAWSGRAAGPEEI